MITVTATLQKKKNIYYAVLYYKDEFNNIQRKWISTKLKVKNNKKLAERKVEEIRYEYEKTLNEKPTLSGLDVNNKANIKFCDFMLNWLEIIKPRVVKTTYAGYERIVKGKVYNYFKKLDVSLKDLKPYHIQDFYTELYKLGLKGNTILRYHANIRKALQYAVKCELILTNPADKVDKPKKEQYIATYYNKSELNDLFVAIRDTPIKLPVLIASYYGLRRSEVLGIKWDAIDFDNKTIIIRHTISQTKVDGKLQIVAEDKTKNQSSYRTLPLIPEIEELLLEEKANQEYNKKIFKKSYLNKDGYVCVNTDGSILKPDYVSHKFNQILKNNNLRPIRFHDLRHSCASLLLSNKVSMKDIQIWLGHSSYNTTANIYTHVDIESKQNSAIVIGNALNFSETTQDIQEDDEEEMEL